MQKSFQELEDERLKMYSRCFLFMTNSIDLLDWSYSKIGKNVARSLLEISVKSD